MGTTMGLIFFFKLTEVSKGGNWAGMAMERFGEIMRNMTSRSVEIELLIIMPLRTSARSAFSRATASLAEEDVALMAKRRTIASSS